MRDDGVSYASAPGGWRAQAACRDADPALFEPLTSTEQTTYRHRPHAHPRIREALSYCAECPVRAQCLAEAVNETQFAAVGVWGGQHIGWSQAKRNLGNARRRTGDTKIREVFGGRSV